MDPSSPAGAKRFGLVARAAVGKGDLLRLLAAGVALAVAAELLGYELPLPEPIPSELPGLRPSASSTAARANDAPEPAAAEAPESGPLERPPLLRVIGPVMEPPTAGGGELPWFLREGAGAACRERDLADGSATAIAVRTEDNALPAGDHHVPEVSLPEPEQRRSQPSARTRGDWRGRWP